MWEALPGQCGPGRHVGPCGPALPHGAALVPGASSNSEMLLRRCWGGGGGGRQEGNSSQSFITHGERQPSSLHTLHMCSAPGVSLYSPPSTACGAAQAFIDLGGGELVFLTLKTMPILTSRGLSPPRCFWRRDQTPPAPQAARLCVRLLSSGSLPSGGNRKQNHKQNDTKLKIT